MGPPISGLVSPPHSTQSNKCQPGLDDTSLRCFSENYRLCHAYMIRTPVGDWKPCHIQHEDSSQLGFRGVSRSVAVRQGSFASQTDMRRALKGQQAEGTEHFVSCCHGWSHAGPCGHRTSAENPEQLRDLWLKNKTCCTNPGSERHHCCLSASRCAYQCGSEGSRVPGNQKRAQEGGRWLPAKTTLYLNLCKSYRLCS